MTVLPGHALCPAVSLSVTGAFREAWSDKLSHSLILTQHHLFPWPRILKIASPSFPLGPVTCEMPQAWGTHVHAYTEHTHSLHTHTITHTTLLSSAPPTDGQSMAFTLQGNKFCLQRAWGVGSRSPLRHQWFRVEHRDTLGIINALCISSDCYHMARAPSHT